MENKYLMVEKDGPVLTITLIQVDHSISFYSDIIIGLTFAVYHAQKDPHIKVIILSDAGRGHANPGMGNTKEFMKRSKTVDGFGILIELILTMKKSAKPIIASVHGAVSAAIFNLVFASDIIIASDNSKFSFPVQADGIPSGITRLDFQSRLVGPYLAKQFRSRTTISAQQLHQLGAINYISPIEKLTEETIELAWKLVKIPEKSFAVVKKIIDTSFIHALEDILERERRSNAIQYLKRDLEK